ncbi:MAG: hypothetical protein AB7J32_10495 [Pseudonocardia sp.]
MSRDGRDVDALLAAGRLERVPPDTEAAARAIGAARRHLRSAEALADIDPDLAYTALYDAIRKSCAALLLADGLRATSRGGHLAVQHAVTALHGARGPLRAFDRVRRQRNAVEYLGGEADPEDVRADLGAARAIVDLAAQGLRRVR